MLKPQRTELLDRFSEDGSCKGFVGDNPCHDKRVGRAFFGGRVQLGLSSRHQDDMPACSRKCNSSGSADAYVDEDDIVRMLWVYAGDSTNQTRRL